MHVKRHCAACTGRERREARALKRGGLLLCHAIEVEFGVDDHCAAQFLDVNHVDSLVVPLGHVDAVLVLHLYDLAVGEGLVDDGHERVHLACVADVWAVNHLAADLSKVRGAPAEGWVTDDGLGALQNDSQTRIGWHALLPAIDDFVHPRRLDEALGLWAEVAHGGLIARLALHHDHIRGPLVFRRSLCGAARERASVLEEVGGCHGETRRL